MATQQRQGWVILLVEGLRDTYIELSPFEMCSLELRKLAETLSNPLVAVVEGGHVFLTPVLF